MDSGDSQGILQTEAQPTRSGARNNKKGTIWQIISYIKSWLEYMKRMEQAQFSTTPKRMAVNLSAALVYALLVRMKLPQLKAMNAAQFVAA